MKISKIEADGFRNLSAVKLEPCGGVNIISGENAQGKTNLLEAVWLGSGAKSFRGAKEREMVGFDRERALVGISFENSYRDQSIYYCLTRSRSERRILLNGVKASGFSELVGKLLLVIFTPDDLELTKGNPQARRNHIDLCVSQLRPSYAGILQRYGAILDQRNALLKSIGAGASKLDELDMWDGQLALQGSYISMLRSVYTQSMKLHASKLYDTISGGREKLTLEYSSTVFDSLAGRTDYNKSMAQEYLNKLKKSRRDDINAGFTQLGVHRDDLEVNINERPVREYGSQGQNRSAALCLKLAHAKEVLNETGEMPVILLDDVLSELDKGRRDFVLGQIKGAQVFITCCEPEISVHGKRFVMRGGKIFTEK